MKVAYNLVDKLFDRRVLTQYTWTGASREKPKFTFAALTEIRSLFFAIISSADNRFSEIDQDNFFKNKILKYGEQRASKCTIMRASTPRATGQRRRGNFVGPASTSEASNKNDDHVALLGN